MFKQLSIFDMPVVPAKKQEHVRDIVRNNSKENESIKLFSLETLMRKRFGVTRCSALRIKPNEGLYSLYRKLANYIYKNGDWNDADLLENAVVVGKLAYNNKQIIPHDEVPAIARAEFVADQDNPMRNHDNLWRDLKDDERDIILINAEGSSQPEWTKLIRLTNTSIGNSKSGRIMYFRGYVDFTFTFINEKKLIGYGRLSKAVLDAYDKQKPDFKRKTLMDLLSDLLNNLYGGKRYGYKFIKFPLHNETSDTPLEKSLYKNVLDSNRALDFVYNFLMSNYNIIVTQRYQAKITKTTRAAAWQTKKHITDATYSLMRHNRLLGAFAKLELDNDVDRQAFKYFEDEVLRVLKVLPKGLTKPVLRLRRLGNYRALGMYVPVVNNIVVDFRGPNDGEVDMNEAGFHSFIHEYGHYLDHQTLKGWKPLSLQPEFADIVLKYQRKVREAKLNKLSYYCVPTEIFARCFERYMDQLNYKTPLLDKHENYLTLAEYKLIDDEMMKEVVNYFDKVFPQIKENLQK